MNILFIDSGIGGLSTLAETYNLLGGINFIYYADDKYSPYGTKSKHFIRKRLLHIINLFEEKVDLIVLACNTATTNAIDYLRKRTKTTIIGTEPAIKPASKQSKNILLIATPRTAKSKRLKQLAKKLNINLKSLALPHLAKDIDEYFLFKKQDALNKINKTIEIIKKKADNCDNIVLGCTHYCFIKSKLAKNVNAGIIDGNLGVAKQVAQYVKNSKQTNLSKQFIISSGNLLLQKKYAKIFKTLANYNDI